MQTASLFGVSVSPATSFESEVEAVSVDVASDVEFDVGLDVGLDMESGMATVVDPSPTEWPSVLFSEVARGSCEATSVGASVVAAVSAGVS